MNPWLSGRDAVNLVEEGADKRCLVPETRQRPRELDLAEPNQWTPPSR